MNNNTINYEFIPITKRTINAVEIFSIYFHKKNNGKGLITIYEMCESIKGEFIEKENNLIINEKDIAKKITKKKIK